MFSNGKISFDSNLGIQNSGGYFPSSKEIRINPYYNTRSPDLIDTLMHELLHAGHDKLGHKNDLMREEIEAWNLGQKFKNKYIREIGKRPFRTKPYTFNELWEKGGYKNIPTYKGHTGKGPYNVIRKTLSNPGVKKGVAKLIKSLASNPKVLLIVLAIILVAGGIYFLVRYIKNRPPKSVTPSVRVETTLTPSTEAETRLTQPALTYNNIRKETITRIRRRICRKEGIKTV